MGFTNSNSIDFIDLLPFCTLYSFFVILLTSLCSLYMYIKSYFNKTLDYISKKKKKIKDKIKF